MAAQVLGFDNETAEMIHLRDHGFLTPQINHLLREISPEYAAEAADWLEEMMVRILHEYHSMEERSNLIREAVTDALHNPQYTGTISRRIGLCRPFERLRPKERRENVLRGVLIILGMGGLPVRNRTIPARHLSVSEPPVWRFRPSLCRSDYYPPAVEEEVN